MDELLIALRLGDAKKIAQLARELLVTSDNELYLANVNEFEHYAPCKIIPQKGDIYHARSYIARIEYNRAVYTF